MKIYRIKRVWDGSDDSYYGHRYYCQRRMFGMWWNIDWHYGPFDTVEAWFKHHNYVKKMDKEDKTDQAPLILDIKIIP